MKGINREYPQRLRSLLSLKEYENEYLSYRQAVEE